METDLHCLGLHRRLGAMQLGNKIRLLNMFSFYKRAINKRILIVGTIAVLVLLGAIFFAVYQTEQRQHQENNNNQLNQWKKTDLRVVMPKWVKEMGIEAPKGFRVFTFEADNKNGKRSFLGYWKGEKKMLFAKRIR